MDVPTTNTFAGYITYCSQQGIISGYADGTFRPSGTLSGNAFMKMLLGALGYDSSREGYTGSNWTVNVIKQAVGIGLDDGNDDFVGSAAVTREEACLYAFNTLQATMVEYENSSTITVGDITITGQGDYSDVTNGTSSDGNIEYDGLMQFAERYFDDLEAEDGTDDFGRPATNWVYDGDDLGTYSNDADETCVVDAASVKLSDLLTDNSYLGYSDSDILDDAVIYFNGQEVDDDDSIYEENDNREDLAGKGDIIEAFENDDGDVDTIVIRSYTYAMIDEVDEDLSSSVQSDGASVGLELVDIDGESLGNGTYYDDHDDDEKVLNGWNSGYEAGTAIAVALGADDAILDSYVMETVTGTPTSARAVETYSYAKPLNSYYGSGTGVDTGNITIDGSRYTYAAQFTGLETDVSVDFDEEYTVYLTAEGYALAVDGDATASLDDVYYVVGVYMETSRGSTSYYAQTISLADGTEYDYRLDTDYETGTANRELTRNVSTTSDFKSVHGFYEFDRDGSSYDATLYTGSSRYDVVTGAGLTNDVTSSSTVIRITDGTRYYENDDGDDDEEYNQDTISRLYLTDTTNFIAAEAYGDELDVSMSTGMMTATAKYSDGSPEVKVGVIYDDDTDALYVVYAAEELSGATDKSDIVYLAGRAATASGPDTYSGDLYFMDDMSLQEEVYISDDGETTQGFYVYDLSDDVYTLEIDTGNEVDVTNGLVDDDADGYAEFVVFTEGRNNTVSSVTTQAAAYGEAGGIYTVGEFDAVSVSGALVVDTRDSSDADDDAYSNDINSPSRLIDALEDGWVSADVYVEDGDIIFVAVRACMDDGSTSDDDDDTESSGDYSSVVDTSVDVLPDGLLLSNASVNDDGELTMPYVESESIQTQMMDALDALGYTDIERPSKSGRTYTTTAYNEDGYLETITFDTADGTAFYTLTVDGELVEYFSSNASETTAPASGEGEGAGYIYKFDEGDWTYTDNNGQPYAGTGANSNVMIRTGYVGVSGGISSEDSNWTATITGGAPDYLTEGDGFDVVLTFYTAYAFDEDTFENFDWTVEASGVTLTCEAELTTEGTTLVAPVVTIHVTVESVESNVTGMTASYDFAQ